MEELKDGLQYARIRKANLRKQAKGLRQVYLRDCLIDWVVDGEVKEHTDQDEV